jgi:hypothetical protein
VLDCNTLRRERLSSRAHRVEDAPVAGALQEIPMRARNVEGHVEIDEEEARSGQTGVHVRYILIFSSLLAAVGFGIALFASLV